MAKYDKSDCRYTKPENQSKQLFSPYPQPIKSTIFSGNNRKERRGIGARFRKIYGKLAFAEMRKMLKNSTIEKVVGMWLQETIEDKNRRAQYGKIILGY